MDNAVFPNINTMVKSIVAGVAEYDNLVADQCALLMQAAELLVSRLGAEGKNTTANLIGALHKGERMATMSRNVDLLSRCPPLERHEWLRAVMALDNLIGRIDDTINESSLMCVETDLALQEMALLVHSAAESLQEGFASISDKSFKVRQQVSILIGLVDAIEMRFMRAMTILFSMEKWGNDVTPDDVLKMIKRWMIYRSLYDVKQHLSTGAETLLALATIRANNRGKQSRILSAR